MAKKMSQEERCAEAKGALAEILRRAGVGSAYIVKKLDKIQRRGGTKERMDND